MDLKYTGSSAHCAFWAKIVSLFSCRASVHQTLGLAVLTLGLAAVAPAQVVEPAGAKPDEKKSESLELEKFSVTGSHIRMATSSTSTCATRLGEARAREEERPQDAEDHHR